MQRTLVDRNIRNDGDPQLVLRDFAQSIGFTKYGLITNGPLQGTAFDEAGNPFAFQYGSNGVPGRNAAGTVIGCDLGFCQGGDVSSNVDSGRSIKSSIERLNAYTRLGYDFAPDNELYVSVNIGQVKTQNQPINGQNRPNLMIQCENPFVPQLVRTQRAAAGITRFEYGTSNAALGSTQVHTDRRQFRFVGGAKGKLPVFGGDWNYDIYFEDGTNYSDIDVDNIHLSRRFDRAIDAITLNGQIVCRDPVARANGCQPLSIIGGNPSEAALRYVQPEKGPLQRTRQTQDVVSPNFSGQPFDLWAGPVSFAFGGELRHEYYRVYGDPYGGGIAAAPANANFPVDPTLLPGGANW